LVLVAGVRTPVGREAVAPPSVCQVAELLGVDCRPGFVALLLEPSSYVLLRPEEMHRASGEDDVVPPVRGRHDNVEDVFVGEGPFVADVDLDRLAAVGTGAGDMAVDMECRRDAEGVPGAVSIPRAAFGLDSVRRRHGRERIGHPDLGAVRLEHEGVGVVEAAERGPDLVAELGLELGERRRPPELDKPPVDVVADLDVAVVHQRANWPREPCPGARHRDTAEMGKTPALAWFPREAADVSALRFRARHRDTPRRDMSVAEMPSTREDHRRVGLLDRSDHFLVALRAAGLDEGADAGAYGKLRPVVER